MYPYDFTIDRESNSAFFLVGLVIAVAYFAARHGYKIAVGPDLPSIDLDS